MLYVSYTVAINGEDSDIDILILVDKDKDKISRDEEIKITHPLYSIEFETDTVISPMVYTKRGRANHRVTLFYENVNREGNAL